MPHLTLSGYTALGLATAALLALPAGCSSEDGAGLTGGLSGGNAGRNGVGGTGGSAGSGIGAIGPTGSGATGSGATGSGATGSGATGGVLIDTSGGTNAGGEAGAKGDGTPEACDGVDNDGNGIIDDVDAGGDGVCDCLNIGTIGQIGPWSNGGNLFSSWLNARTPQGAVALDDEVLTSAVLARLQVIVVLHVDTTSIESNGTKTDAHHAFSDAETKAFGDWVKDGGGAMATIGYTNNEAAEVLNVNRLLATVGMAYSATKLTLEGDIADWTAHPLSEGVKKIFTANGVEPDGADGTTLAKDSEGHVALQVTQADSGRVVVWGDEWMTYDSEWADVQDQQVELFWLNILKWLSPPKTCQVPIPPSLVK